MKNKNLISIVRRYLTILLVGAMLLSTLSGCKGDASNTDSASSNSDSISIVTTIFPEYDWAKQVVGDTDNVNISMLLDNGVDLHSYQPTADDIMKISDCDMFIYVGGESDEWVEDALKEATNKDMVVINLLDILGESQLKEEEVKEGMEAEEEDDAEGDEESPEIDEHVWLSLKNAAILVDEIASDLASIDSEHADTYQSNAENYINSLTELDQKYQETVQSATNKTVVFGDRFPFRYMVDDYGLDYYAAFVGCSAETEASFETVTFLANKMDELGLKYIFTIENSDQKIAKTVIDNTASKDAVVLTLDSMQSTTSEDVKNGATYLNIMESNLSVLKEALQ